jgi:hypothetical protein
MAEEDAKGRGGGGTNTGYASNIFAPLSTCLRMVASHLNL